MPTHHTPVHPPVKPAPAVTMPLQGATPLAEPASPVQAAPAAQSPATVAPSSFGWACSKCRFAGHMSDGTLQCRQVAPVATSVAGAAAWATVLPTDWCGIYSPE